MRYNVIRRLCMALMIVGVMVLPALIIDDIVAQPKFKNKKAQMAKAGDRQSVRQAIIRTRQVIRRAYGACKSKNTLADNKQTLKRSMQHNKVARRLLVTGQLPGAMKHTLRGRQLALQVLAANKQQPAPQEALTADETAMLDEGKLAQMDSTADSEPLQDAQMEAEALNDIDL